MRGARTAKPVRGKASEVGLRQELKAVRGLAPYLWPRDWDLRARVLVSLAFLIVAKLVNVYVPLLYKGAIDALSPGIVTATAAVPIRLIVAHGGARIGAQLFARLRHAVFAQGGPRAGRRGPLATFRPLPPPSLRLHPA